VDLLRSQLGALECATAGVDGERRHRAPDVTLADARTGDDPLVGGVETGLELGVGDDGVGQGRAPSGDDRAREGHVPSAVTRNHAMGSPAATRSPGWARNPTTVPAKGVWTSAAPTVPSRSPTATGAPSVRGTSVPSGESPPGPGAARPATGSNTP